MNILKRSREPSGIKNIRARHDWKITGGYDPEQDGPDPQWGRMAIRCRRCGEERRVFQALSMDAPGVALGCVRNGKPSWQRGDLLVRDGQYLDQFVRRLRGGRVLTWDGGHYHESAPDSLAAAG